MSRKTRNKIMKNLRWIALIPIVGIIIVFICYMILTIADNDAVEITDDDYDIPIIDLDEEDFL